MKFKILVSAIAPILLLPLMASAQSKLELPPLTGEFKVGHLKYQLTDFSREETFTSIPTDKRQIGVQVWYPSQNVPGAIPPPYLENVAQQDLLNAKVPEPIIPALRSIRTRSIPNAPTHNRIELYPIIFFSPGYGGNLPRTHLTHIEELASHGYIVIGLIHLDPSTKITRKIINKALQERVTDVQFVLNSLTHIDPRAPHRVLSPYLDVTKVGIVGHSMGGTTAAEIIGLDTRFSAGISLDGQSSRQMAKLGLSRPFMLINQYSMSLSEPTQQQIYRRSRHATYSVSLKGAAHDAFTDIPFLASLFPQYNFSSVLSPLFPTKMDPNPQRIDPALTLKHINDYSIAFFDRHLKQKAAPLLHQKSTHPSIIYKFRNNPE